MPFKIDSCEISQLINWWRNYVDEVVRGLQGADDEASVVR